MNKEEIMKIIPHRDKMLLVDEAEVKDGEAIGKYTVRGDEHFLCGHFPGNPIVPGVILCEMMAQASCVLLSNLSAEATTPYFTGLDKVRFKKSVLPGDTLETHAVITRSKPPFYFASAKGYVEGKLCVSAEFSFALVANK
ncbi:MAG: 3-hydroxyacyl-ACP dehydratase FabZ [Synergistes sp.]|nr:3-hydroxyacyl-ACP dehydratase FabZ [Clostridia bacterium]MBQ9882535.1 3-hydroxyacyl-ACP dehydratase FabZ [Synergistes sp.]